MLRSPKTGVHSVGVGLICTLESNWLEYAEKFGTERRVAMLKRLSIHLDTLLYDGRSWYDGLCCRRSEMTPPL
jgi:hypothetical protein